MAAKTPRRSEAIPAVVATAHAPWWRQRAAVLAGGAALLLILLIGLAGPGAGVMFAHLIPDAVYLAAWLVAAAGYGSALLALTGGQGRGASSADPPGIGELLEGVADAARPRLHDHSAPRPSPFPESGETELGRVTLVAAGLGLLSLIQLGLGLVGFLHRWTGFLVILLGVALFAWRQRRATGNHVGLWLRGAGGWHWLWLFAIPPLAMAIVAAYVPPGVLWGDEPHGYDVLEYHLQLPREWFELRAVRPLRHNVFSHFPLAVEMHYLLAMQLRGGPWAGMYLAQLMHVAFVALSVVAVHATARQFAPARHAVLAAVAAANVPWLALLGPVAYNEGGLMLFATLAVAWALRAIGTNAPARSRGCADAEEASPRGSAATGDSGDRRTITSAAGRLSAWVIGGTMAGFACGTKLTGVPQVLLLVPPFVAIVAIVHRRPVARVLTGAILFVAAGTLVFSPWLARNVAWTGNPVFPEAQSLFGRAHFSEAQAERWKRAHAPTERQRPVAARLAAAKDQILTGWRFGWLLLPAGLAATIATFRRPQAKLLLALLLAWLVFWLGFTHLQGRFYVPAIPLAAVALALLHGRAQAAALAVLVAGQVAVGLTSTGSAFAARVAPLRDVLAFEDLAQMQPTDVQDVLSRPGADVALAGDAKAFLYPIPMSRLTYRTVFDVDAQPGQNAVAAWLAGRADSPLIIVDPNELARFAQTYRAIPPLGDDVPGPRDRPFVLAPQPPPAAAAPTPP